MAANSAIVTGFFLTESFFLRGYRTVVVHQPSKLRMRVRFPLPAPSDFSAIMKNAMLASVLMAASTVGTGCESESVRNERERKQMLQMIEQGPEIQGDEAVFHLYGPGNLISSEYRIMWENRARIWALEHNARQIESFSTHGYGSDYHLRFKLPSSPSKGASNKAENLTP